MIRFYSTSAKPFHSDHYHRLVSLIDSCKSMQQITQTHAQLITTALISHPISAIKLLKLAICASLSYAHKLFDQIPQLDLFIYNTMIKAHPLSLHSCHNSIVVFRSLTRDSGLSSNQYSFVFAFGAYGNGLGVQEGEQVFQWAEDRDLYSWNTMIAAYVGSDNMSQAKQLFDGMQERDVVSWSTIIAGYVQYAVGSISYFVILNSIVNGLSKIASCLLHVGCFMEALDFFHKMLQIGPKPNVHTLVNALSACSNMVALDQGKWIHAYTGRVGIKMNERLLASIIDMYAKCGEIESTSRVFFEHKAEKVSPNKVTFISLLNACSHGYMVEEEKLYFRFMVSDYAIAPEIKHYGCMVDLLGRASLLKEAEDMISTIYSTYGRWNEARMLRDKDEISSDRKKISCCNSIELKRTFHQFLVGDRSHPQSREIYSFLDEMIIKLKSVGYVPELGELLHDIDVEEDKESALFVHSEKLAISFGLMNTEHRTPICIIKNLRNVLDGRANSLQLAEYLSEYLSFAHDLSVSLLLPLRDLSPLSHVSSPPSGVLPMPLSGASHVANLFYREPVASRDSIIASQPCREP
ncbi:hypothetical protein Fmac_024471 [Flemingia macrophylla]|uniref:DYW domain-containing protein n=1 Tax=Flemingia macrophylla TaxID=520843 RepID=A0ABD1LQ08_9FABA